MGFFKHKPAYNYFDGFMSSAKAAQDAAVYLNNALNNYDPDSVSTYIIEMHKIENAADMIKHELTKKLAHEFLPPIELEDISALSQELDNIVDSIEDVMRQIYMHNVTEIRPEVTEFCSLILECSDAFIKLVEEFEGFKHSERINDCVIAVNAIESRGDRLHEKCLRRLFTHECDPKTLLVWSVIFDGLENCLDSFENASDVIESAVMKNT